MGSSLSSFYLSAFCILEQCIRDWQKRPTMVLLLTGRVYPWTKAILFVSAPHSNNRSEQSAKITRKRGSTQSEQTKLMCATTCRGISQQNRRIFERHWIRNAIDSGSRSAIVRMLDRNVDLACRDNEGYTVLHARSRGSNRTSMTYSRSSLVMVHQ